MQQQLLGNFVKAGRNFF